MNEGVRQRNARRQNTALMHISRAHEVGLTVADLRNITGEHHGVASGVLSRLHKTGRAARLSEKRSGCHVYVTPDNVAGRMTDRQGRRASSVTEPEPEPTPEPEPEPTPDGDPSPEYEEGYHDNERVMRAQLRSILRRYVAMRDTRLYGDLRNWLESES